MPTYLAHRHILSLVFLASFCFFGLLAYLFPSKVYFSVVRVKNAELTTHIVSSPFGSAAACRISLQNQLQNIQVACTTCITTESQCSEQLSGLLKQFVTDTPLKYYSAVLPNGFAIYESANLATSLQACMQSEQLSHNRGVSFRCYAPYEPRFEAVNQRFLPAFSVQNLWQPLSILSLLIAAWLFALTYKQFFATEALKLSRPTKQAAMTLFDLATLEICLYLAKAILLESLEVPFAQLMDFFLLTPVFALPIFFYFGLYNAIMRYVGTDAMIAIVKAVGLYTLLLGIWVMWALPHAISENFVLIHGLLVLVTIGASRVIARRWLSNAQNHNANLPPRKRALIYGAGSAGVQLALALSQSREVLPVAFVDDDSKLHHKQIAGLTVYSRQELHDLVNSEHISEVLLALPSTSRTVRNTIISALESLPVQVRTLPGVAHLAEGKVKTSDLREVDIEDLLGRDPVPPKIELLETNIKYKAVMVTGAGGSIGSELCRQILLHKPQTLVLFELNEFALYSIEQELLVLYPSVSNVIIPILGSVTDPFKLDLVMKRFGIQTIFHAAAYKHVPMVEKNPCAGAYNNIMGTWHTSHAAQNNSVETFVLISTDKAVRPTNTMGTTKRMSELILQALNQITNQRTCFVMVRFGNVLGSSGSVLPIFKEQIKNGGPITVTDPRIIRYFMTIPEAAQLVIQAGAMGQGGDVFVLDMGEPVKILDLAQKMIHLSGMSVRDETNPSGDIEIAFSGLRPGEKLFEELLIGENATPTEHPRILRANERMLSLEELTKHILQIEATCMENNSGKLRHILETTVSEFAPQCGNEDLLAS